MTRVLLIEDNLFDQLAFRQFIKKKTLSYKVVMVGSVREAVSKMSREPFDVILSDYLLEDGTAFDFLHAFPKLQVPVIIVTGSGAETVAVRALKLGAHDYLVKDISNKHFELIPLAIEKAIRQQKNQEIERMTQYDRSVAGILTTNGFGRLCECNKTFAQMMGFYSPRHLQLDPHWMARFERLMASLIPTVEQQFGFVINREIELFDREDRPVHVLANFNMTPSPSKSKPSLNGTLIDISRLKNEERHRKAQEAEVSRLQKMLTLREDMSLMLVHDLRNPLSVVGLSAEMILEASDKPFVRSMAERIVARTMDLQDLIDDMLTVARMERGALALLPQLHDLSLIVERGVQHMTPMAEQRKVFLMVESTIPAIEFRFDVKLMQRVIENLLSNAIKYSPDMGRVTVKLDMVDGPNHQIARMHVIDEGVGVPFSDRDRIFERFVVGQAEAANGGQIGLGLSFCKMVIDAHGGEISVGENFPSGAVFTVSLPMGMGED